MLMDETLAKTIIKTSAITWLVAFLANTIHVPQ